jgi:DNA-binding NarL/FixJ family response regulator
MKCSILIADDELLFAEGLQCLFEKDGRYKVCGVASSESRIIRLVKEGKADVVILNPNMNSSSGLNLLDNLHSISTDIKVIFLCSHLMTELAVKALNKNLNAYLLRDVSFLTLCEAIDTVTQGEIYIEDLLLNSINHYMAVNENKSDYDLTRREIEILKLIVGGALNKEIGAALNISERTVKNYVSRLFKKIGVSDRTQAAVYAIKNDIVKI